MTFCPHKKEQNCYREKRFRASNLLKMHLRPGLRYGAYSASPDPLSRFGERRGREGEREWKRKGGKGEGERRGRGKGCPPNGRPRSAYSHCSGAYAPGAREVRQFGNFYLHLSPVMGM